jgi:hypothetical protein
VCPWSRDGVDSLRATGGLTTMAVIELGVPMNSKIQPSRRAPESNPLHGVYTK